MGTQPGDSVAFLRDTLALWEVEGSADADLVSDGVSLRGPDGTLAIVQRAACGDPFRWYVRWKDRASALGTLRTRPCGSLVGVLAALRRAFGVERGSAIRIAPQAESATLPRAREADMPPSSQAGASPAGHDSATATTEPHNAAGDASAQGRIPVSVLTGFLGSGKTTLLARLLRHPAMGRTAVIVNELGEIGLDHDLIETSDENFVRLTTGCLCCKVRSDLLLTLGELAARRSAGDAPFERVVIETSGLADPAPILHALMTDRGAAERYALEAVVTTVDALTGLAALDRHPECVRQAALADTIVLTKTDLSQADVPGLGARLRGLNADARIMPVVLGDVTPAALFGPTAHAAHSWRPAPDHAHTEGIAAFGLVRDRPLNAATLALFLSALADNCGDDLLRMKGLVHVAETPGQPAVVHGVQHVYHAPQWLARWPSADTRTRMTFIGRGIPPQWASSLLDLLDAEVADQAACSAHERVRRG